MVRLDKTPINRDGGLWDKREVDPDATQLSRRAGSLRQAEFAEAPGVIGTGGASLDMMDATIVMGSILFSVRPGAGATDRRLLYLNNGTDSLDCVLVDETTLRIRATGATLTSTSDYTIAGDTDCALYISGTVFGISDGSTSTTVDISTMGITNSGFSFSLFGDSAALGRDTTSLANVHIYETYQATPSYGSRTQTADYSFPLNVGTPHYQLSGTTALTSDTGEPSYVSGTGLRFGGRSGAAIIEVVGPLFDYFQTAIQSTNTSRWCYQTTVTPKVSGVAYTIADFGDLLLLRRLADNTLEATINSVTIPNASLLTAGTEAFISVGQDVSGTRITVTIAGTTVTGTGVIVQAPYIDLARIPDFYIGSKEDPSEHFFGTIKNSALFPMFSDGVLPPQLSTFAFDFDHASTPDLDQGLSGTRYYLSPHTTTVGWLGWGAGPISDSSHTLLIGGEAAGPVGISGYDAISLTDTLIDASGSVRLGHQVYGPTWVADTVRKRIRQIGLPRPVRKPSLTALGVGALDGAYSYGIRAVSYDGSAGPVLQIGEVKATGATRVIIGSSSGSGDGDVFDSSELGETYLETGVDTPGVRGDHLTLELASAPSLAANHTIEVNTHIPDWTSETYRETTAMRGSLDNITGSEAYWKCLATDIGIDLSSNFSVQTTFRYTAPKTPTSGWKSFGIFGIQDMSNHTFGNGESYANPDISAFIVAGHTSASHYGSTAPRLVIAIARQKFDVAFKGDVLTSKTLYSNTVPITFTDDTWTVGKDYTIIVDRQGAGLSVYVHDIQADTWTTLTSRSMSALGDVLSYGNWTNPAILTYDATDVFAKMSSSGHNFPMARPARSMVAANAGSDYMRFHQMNTSGQVVQAAISSPADYRITAAPSEAVFYHARVWSDSQGLQPLRGHAHKRFAAFPGEPLDTDILVDFAPIFDDPDETDDERYDAALATTWRYRQGAVSDPATAKAFEQDFDGLKPRIAPMLSLAQADTAVFGTEGIQMYFSELGDGTLFLRVVGDGSFSIPDKIWNAQTSDVKFTKTVLELRNLSTNINAWDTANWFAFDLEILEVIGNNTRVSVGNLAVNGDVPFVTAIGGSATIKDWVGTVGRGAINIGGYSNSTEKTTTSTAVSEFRMWADGQGPKFENGGTGFDYLQGRVSENEYTGGTTNLVAYARMQPGDSSKTPIVEFTLLDNVGSDINDFQFVGNATLKDLRTPVADGQDPAPTVSLPNVPPHPDIAFFELVRSLGVVIPNPDNADDVQNALQAARGADQFSRAFISVGATHYVDSGPDETLGLPVSRTSGLVPNTVSSATTWQGRLTLLDDRNTLHVSDALNRESFSFPYIIPVGISAGPALGITEVQGSRNQSFLLVAGQSWAGMVGGTPDAPTWTVLGPGAGIASAACLATFSGMSFMYNGRLWAIADGDTGDIGEPVQHLLPPPANAALFLSGALRSLYVVDTTTGIAMRYHLPTRTWTTEDRSAIEIGDTVDGKAAIVHVHGSWSKGDSDTFADDAGGSELRSQAGTISGAGTTIVLTAGHGFQNGQRITVIDSAGGIASGVCSLATNTLTFSPTLALANGSCTTYPCAHLLVDTGAIDVGAQEQSLGKLQTEVLSGTTWEAAFWASRTPGDLATIANTMSYDTMAGLMGSARRGRFHRILVRQLDAEAASVSILEPQA